MQAISAPTIYNRRIGLSHKSKSLGTSRSARGFKISIHIGLCDGLKKSKNPKFIYPSIEKNYEQSVILSITKKLLTR